ncbi:hypothetical protein RND81_07G181500 [Saponaria officinalis]|uniref:RRM domain-containing protein n=1 Tax=Saponaria officinalis TaxID=3572 RepID=A0AAW1JPS7_SAPOF
MAMSLLAAPYSHTNVSESTQVWKQSKQRDDRHCFQTITLKSQLLSSSFSWFSGSSELCRLSYPVPPFVDRHRRRRPSSHVMACTSSSSSLNFTSSTSTRLYISGLSFRTTEESLRNAFVQFGQLVEVNLVMDKIANRPRGFAFVSYATEEESKNAIEGMHGKFLDGRVIFVEVAKPRSDTRKNNQISRGLQR